MKKVLSLVLAMLLIFSLAACSSESDSTVTKDTTPKYNVEITIDCIPNLIFSKYDVNVKIDNESIGEIEYGSEGDFKISLKEGQHKLTVEKSTNSNVDGGITFNVSSDMKLDYEMTLSKDQIELTEKSDETQSKESEEEIKTETEQETQKEEILTLSNCKDLENLIGLDLKKNSAEIEKFANEYSGKTIKLELITGYVCNHENYNTRFDYNLYAVRNENVMLKGPVFAFRNVGILDLHLTGDNIPDYFEEAIICDVTAVVEGFDNGAIKLDPVEVRVIKDCS